MTSGSALQNAYVDLYTNLRNYLWGFDTVTTIAKLEVAVYDRFPIKSNIETLFNDLLRDITAIDDEDLKKSIDEFRCVLDEADEVYSKLPEVQEVIQNAN